MKKHRLGLIILAIFISTIFIYYNYSTHKSEEIQKGLKKEYPSIDFNERINAVITLIYIVNPTVLRNDPHQAFLVFDNSFNKRISTGYELTQELKLDDVISIGDRIIKESGSYMFFLYKIHAKDTLKYVFELHDDLGYPLKNKK